MVLCAFGKYGFVGKVLEEHENYYLVDRSWFDKLGNKKGKATNIVFKTDVTLHDITEQEEIDHQDKINSIP